MEEIVIRDFRAEDAAWLIAQHGALYARDEGFDESFEALVSDIVAKFIVGHDRRSERGWIAQQGAVRLGSIFCVRMDAEVAQLRLFLTLPEARGQGLGRRLLGTCLGFAKRKGYARMKLWTHESHAAACALYSKTGWQMTEAKEVVSFGVPLVEQTWEISLSNPLAIAAMES